MDANGQRFWLVADDRHWRRRSHVDYFPACRALRLASERTLSAPPADAASIAASAQEQLARSVDLHGALARWNPDLSRIEACSALGDATGLLGLPLRPFDFAPGFDDVLYVALDERVLLHDLRGRWPDTVLATPRFQAWRLAADPAGGAWLLERASGRLARLTGCVPAARPAADYVHSVFRPAEENPTPPTLRVLDAPGWSAGERVQSIAVSGTGEVALLSWIGDGECRLRTLDRDAARLDAPQALKGVRFAYSLDWLADGKVAVRAPGRRDAPVFLPRTAPGVGEGAAALSLRPTGDIHPLATDAEEGPFAHHLDGPPRYPVSGPGAGPGDGPGLEPLHRLSIAHLAARGEAASYASAADAHVIDSGDAATVWHRACLEARVPAACGICLWLAASDELDPASVSRWHPHLIGEVPADDLPAGALPRAAWERLPSELPGHPGLGAWGAPEPGRAGLWSVLIQRVHTRVRSLTGRYLWLRVSLYGDGRDSPELAAVRAYGSRFSYRDRYLPRLYRETEHGAAAERPGDALLSLAGAVAADLDAGDAVPAALADPLELGGGTRVEVLEIGQRWQIRDGGAGIVLRAEDAGDTVVAYRPRSTPADFTERFLGNVEGWLTMLEDRVAAAHLASDPAVVPEESLEWLAAWLGVAFDPALPESQRRDWLSRAAELARHHGTRHGLRLALDVATGGGVRGGEIIVVEGFRLRRLMATLLGVDLGVEDDPLLPGLIINTNSVVGDTLILGESERLELLALFRDEVADAAASEAVLAFYGRLAYRALVLVHQEVEPQDLGLVRRVVELEAPAHVTVQVATATWPLLVGIASLVGVDTYLGPPRPPRPAVAGRSHLGNGDRVLGVGSLDPRVSGAPTGLPPAIEPLLPIADAGPDRSVRFAESFHLDGSGSSAPGGRRISEYRWRMLE